MTTETDIDVKVKIPMTKYRGYKVPATISNAAKMVLKRLKQKRVVNFRHDDSAAAALLRLELESLAQDNNIIYMPGDHLSPKRAHLVVLVDGRKRSSRMDMKAFPKRHIKQLEKCSK